MELPAIIRPVGAGDDDEHADLLVEALIENDLRRDLDPLARARGYQRLIDSGRTVKGVAERLKTTQARVREHLRILKLREPQQQQVAAATFRFGPSSNSHSSTASTQASPPPRPARFFSPRIPTSRTRGPTSSERRSTSRSQAASCRRACIARTPRTRSARSR